MTKNQVIERLFLSKNFLDCIGKMEPAHLQDDLKSEVILILLEMNEEKLMGLHERKELEFYTVRIILNLIKSDTSPFAKTYRKQHAVLNEMTDHPIADIIDIVERGEVEKMQDIVLSEIDNIHWYKSELVKLYQSLGNYRAIEQLTGIPYISCYKTIKKSFEELKERAKQKVI